MPLDVWRLLHRVKPLSSVILLRTVVVLCAVAVVSLGAALATGLLPARDGIPVLAGVAAAPLFAAMFSWGVFPWDYSVLGRLERTPLPPGVPLETVVPWCASVASVNASGRCFKFMAYPTGLGISFLGAHAFVPRENFLRVAEGVLWHDCPEVRSPIRFESRALTPHLLAMMSAPSARGLPYRVPAQGPSPAKPIEAPRPVDPYVTAWRQLERRRFVVLGLVALCVPILPVAATYLGERWPDAVLWALPALPALPVLVFVALVRLYLFLCPRCRDLFFVKKGLHRAALADIFRVYHCPHCHVRTGIPGPLR